MEERPQVIDSYSIVLDWNSFWNFLGIISLTISKNGPILLE